MGQDHGPAEARAVALVNKISALLRGEVDIGPPALVPEGPNFCYGPAPELFLGRTEHGPLRVMWDTNILIDYFQHGHRLWEGDPPAPCVPIELEAQLEALQLIVTLSVFRDIRFELPDALLDDAKRSLSGGQRMERATRWTSSRAR